MLVNDMNINGISMVIMNYCKNLDKSKFDISVISGTPINDFYKSQCREFNIKLYELPARKQKKLKYFQALYRVLKQKFDIVHVHGNSATISIELLIAKICGVKVRIAHSHNTTCDHIKIHKLLWPLFRQVYTHGLACGQQAGKWMFHNGKFYVLPNAFETANFIYDNEARQRIRNELKLDNKYVIGHIGRFNNQKNHPFLLRIFTEIAKKREDAYLLLVGNGPDFEEVQKLISKLLVIIRKLLIPFHKRLKINRSLVEIIDIISSIFFNEAFNRKIKRSFCHFQSTRFSYGSSPSKVIIAQIEG